MFQKPSITSYPVVNWEEAKKFYGETLGLPVATSMPDEAGWMEFGEKDGARLAISLWRGPDAVPPKEGGATVIFEVEDAFKTVEELRARGVKCDDVEVVPELIAFANIYDPEGNRLQVAGPPPAA